MLIGLWKIRGNRREETPARCEGMVVSAMAESGLKGVGEKGCRETDHMSTASLTMEQRIWRCSVGPARAGLPKLLDSVLHGWLGARGAPTSAGRSWAGTQCNQFKESAIKSSGAGRGGAGGRCWKVCWSRVCKSQTRKMIVCGFLKALARRHRKYFIFDLHCVCACV